MNNLHPVSWATAILALGLSTASLAQLVQPAQPKGDCTITCYQKTPTCYVTKEDKGCLKLNSEIPGCSNNICICTLKDCKPKTTYTAEHPEGVVEPTIKPAGN